MGQLNDRTALITGASRGIGRAIAILYGREGANVIVNYVSDRIAADEVVGEIGQAGGKAIAIQANIVDPLALRALFGQADETFGGLDIVVLNAHPGLGHGPITQVEDQVVDGQLAVLKSYVLGLQEAGRRVRDNGVIISISSSATHVSFPAVAMYGAVKMAVEYSVPRFAPRTSATRRSCIGLGAGADANRARQRRREWGKESGGFHGHALVRT